MRPSALLALASLALYGCGQAEKAPVSETSSTDSYYDMTAHPDAWSGGARLVPISTPKGEFKVWIKRHGNNPKLKLLLLHGGPAMGHDYMEGFDGFLPATRAEYYFYDQLGSGRSDRSDDDSLWTIPRFVDEVEQVRKAIGADKSNFCLLGHSWGGMLAIEYALAHQDQIKCLVISNMMASIPAYNRYADTVLKPQMNPAALKEILALEEAGKTEDPRYMELLMPNFYEQHILRRPAAQWPEPATRTAGINRHIYTLMQGPSEMGASGRLADWDRFKDLRRIKVPTLVISGRHDTMDPAYMAAMAKQLPQGELLATNGGHMDFYDDQPTYAAGLGKFLTKFR